MPWDSRPPNFSVLYSMTDDKRCLRGRSWIPGTRDGMRWTLALSEGVAESTGTGTIRWNGIVPQVRRLYFCGKQGSLTKHWKSKRGHGWMRARSTNCWSGIGGDMKRGGRRGQDGWPMFRRQSTINCNGVEVYTPERKRAYITVSRQWSRANNSAPDFLWDSFLSALLVCQEDERKSFALVRDITDWQNEQGMFLQYGQWPTHPDKVIFPAAWGHTQYPIGSLAVSKIYLRRPNKEFLADIYPRLLKAHRWWFSDRGDGQPWRDGNKNGLLELGSNYPEEIPYEDRQQVAYFESHDDSPEWWHVAAYNEKTQTCELDTVERNCLYTMDAWVLAWMARELGRTADAANWSGSTRRWRSGSIACSGMTAKNCYFNRRWAPANGSWFNPQMAPDVFFALLGRVAPPDRYEALRKVFYDPEKIRRRVDSADHQPRRSDVPATALLAGEGVGTDQLAGVSGIQDARVGSRGAAAGRVKRKDVSEAVAREG